MNPPRDWKPSDPEAWKGATPSGPMDGDREAELDASLKAHEEKGDELLKRLDQMNKELRWKKELRKQEDVAKGIYYPDTFEDLVEMFEDDKFPGLKFYIVKAPNMDTMGMCLGGDYCGYVRFPERPVKEKGYDGILTYVTVHGGITFAEQDNKGMVYGFDCRHCDDGKNPEKFNDMDWMRNECKRMAASIHIAAQYEKQYLDAGDDNEKKAELLDHFYSHIKDHGMPGFNTDEGWNFGTAINLMGGDL